MHNGTADVAGWFRNVAEVRVQLKQVFRGMLPFQTIHQFGTTVQIMMSFLDPSMGTYLLIQVLL